MRKTLLLFVTIATMFLLVACNKNKTHASVELKNVQRFEDSITFDLHLTDPNEEIGEDVDLVMAIRQRGQSSDANSQKVEKKELENDNKFSFKKLNADKFYTIKVTTTINNKTVELFQGEYKTDSEAGKNEIDINTVEDFLLIKENPGATYYLKADLDFEGYEDQINGKSKTGDTPAIPASYITTFDGIFYGGNFTISNYVLNKGSSHFGLFGTLSNDAKVIDLTIDNMSIDISTTGSTRQAGLLFGRALNNNIIIDNINILNSSLSITLDSTSSNNHNIGLLGGRSTAQISNIYIDENTKLTVDAKRIGEPRIGGLIGQVNDKNASIKNIEVNGEIEVNVDQVDGDNKKGLSGSRINMLIGGVIGHAWQLSMENIVSRTKVNVNKLDFVIDKVEDQEGKIKTEELFLSIRVGGLFGALGNTRLSNAVYEGDINIAAITIEDKNFNAEDPKAKVPYKYIPYIFAGSIASEGELASPDYNNVLRINGLITISEQEDVKVLVGNLFGQIKNPAFKYNEKNRFGILGDIAPEVLEEQIKIFTDLKELFDEDSWVYKTYNKID